MSKEYAVLNKPGFKVIMGSQSNKVWTRIHNGERATSPYVNLHRWWTGIKEYEVAEYISLKSKINHWKRRKKSKQFDGGKFAQYNQSLQELLEEYDEGNILGDMVKYEWATDFISKEAMEMFIF